jgi:hypothetical protein
MKHILFVSFVLSGPLLAASKPDIILDDVAVAHMKLEFSEAE